MSVPPFRTNVHKHVLIHMVPTDVLVELATHLKVMDTRAEVILACFQFTMVICISMLRCFRVASVV